MSQGPVDEGIARNLDVNHVQLGRRIFIGPMPQKRLTALNEEDEEQVTAFVRQHGLKLFLKSGGRMEDWTETKAKEYKERLLDYVQHSIWHVHPKKKKKGMVNPMAKKWSGDTFEVGKVVGVNVNMLAAPEEEPEALQATVAATGFVDIEPRPPKSALAVHWDTATRFSETSARSSLRSPKSSSKAPNSFVTAPESPAVSLKAGFDAFSENDVSEEPSEHPQDESASSSTAFVSRLIFSGSMDQSSSARPTPNALGGAGTSTKLKSGIKSILTNPNNQRKDKGKRKAVSIQEPIVNREEAPVTPEEVLRRSPEDVQDSAAAEAISEATSEASSVVSDSWSDVKYGEIVMRGTYNGVLLLI